MPTEAILAPVPVKIALINVRYSPNLGDGLLSECLEAELRKHLPDCSFVTVDLAGRTHYSPGSRWRRPVMNALLAAPAALRRWLMRRLLDTVTKRLAPRFAAAMADCRAAILGGGNLLSDADLNFPRKIDSALAAARSASATGLPLAIYAVGVSRNWSREGAALFRRMLRQPSLVSVAVRDELSRGALVAQAGPDLGAREVAVVHDPGLLASRHFEPASTPLSPPIGLCITAPVALRYHGGKGDNRALARWIGELVDALALAGHEIMLFTNGSPEDRHFLRRHADSWSRACPTRVHVAPAAEDPEALVRIITGCSLIVAHRMHACIAAHSFGIPTIGLRWDPKLDAFFELAGRTAYLHTAGLTPVQTVVSSAVEALGEGVDREALASLIAEAESDVAALARTLREAIV